MSASDSIIKDNQQDPFLYTSAKKHKPFMKKTQQVFDKIKNSNDMPSLPHVLLKLIEACNNSDVTPRELSCIISKDTALSATVMRILHSPYSGLNNKVGSIEQAVIFLGIDTIKNIAISASIRQVFSHAEDNTLFQMNRFWLSSILCAIFARRIAKKLSYNSPEEAFLAGILHDIGTLLLWTHFREPYSGILKHSPDPQEQAIAEKKEIGADHCELGAWLTREWHLNRNISDAIQLHHDRQKSISSDYPLTKIVYSANLLSHAFIEGQCPVDTALQDIFDFSTAECLRIVKGVKEEALDVAGSIDIQLHFPDAAAPAAIEDDLDKQKELAEEVQRISLLNGTLQHLIKADNTSAIFKIARHGLQVLFSIDKLVFFLHDSRDNSLTTGRIDHAALERFSHQQLSPRKDTSLVSRCFRKKATLDSFQILTNENQTPSDETFIKQLHSEGILCIPLIVHQKTTGVMLIGLSMDKCLQVLNEIKVLTMFANHVAISMHVDHIKHEQIKNQYDERMDTYIQFARNIVHEVNNPLSIIKNYLKMLTTKLPDQNDITNDIKIMDEEINRISNLIVNLRHFSNPNTTCSEGIDVHQILSNIVNIFSKAILTPAQIMVRFDADPAVPKITSNANLLKQVFVNLLKNAAEAMPNGGIITIQTAPCPPAGPHRNADSGNNLLEGVQIIIRDNGPGIPQQILSRLFEPFNSSKRSNHSGLGLSVVHNIIKQLNGSIDCASAKETGTSFTIHLPLSCKRQ